MILVGLKLTGVIDWSWWWVFSPVWLCVVGIILFWVVLIEIAREEGRYDR